MEHLKRQVDFSFWLFFLTRFKTTICLTLWFGCLIRRWSEDGFGSHCSDFKLGNPLSRKILFGFQNFRWSRYDARSQLAFRLFFWLLLASSGFFWLLLACHRQLSLLKRFDLLSERSWPRSTKGRKSSAPRGFVFISEQLKRIAQTE